MKKNKGFTMPELIAIIVLISIILILIIPNIVTMSDKSKISLHESKIRTLETAAEKYGNAFINNYQECINGSDESFLNSKCLVNIHELVTKEYITADQDYDVIDPSTNKPFTGNILLCYDPSKINIYAKYLGLDETPQCRDINVTTGEYLYLSSGNGISYNGGNSINVKILKMGTFKSLTCDSDNKDIVTCEIEGNNLKLSLKKKPDFTNESETVKIKVVGKPSSGEKDLSQTYTLKVLPTSISIDQTDHSNKCLETNATEEFKITGTNIGTLKVITDEEAVKINLRNNTGFVLNTLNKTGDVKVTIQEENGNEESSIERTIYKLELDKEMPAGLLLGNKENFTLDYGGNDSVTITSDNPDVLQIYKDNVSESVNSLTLSGNDKTFGIKTVNKGQAKITIVGNKCGRKEFDLTISNLYIEDSKAEIFVGGKSFETKIVSSGSDIFTCTSSDETAAKCEVSGSNLKIIPGDKASNQTIITVNGAGGGYDTIEVETKDTSIRLLNQDGTVISRVCSNIESGPNETITASGANMGSLTVSEISDRNILDVSLSNNTVIPFNKNLTSLDGLSSNYKLGINTGISKVTIKESNGNKSASFDYNIFDIATTTGSSRYQVTLEDSIQVKIKSSATGPLRVVSNDESIASVTVNNPSYSFDINAENESTLTITGKKTGTTTITVTGAYCGTLTISIDVIGKEFYLNLELGTYTKGLVGIDAGRISCSTEGTDDSCNITLPEFITSAAFVANGFSKIKDSKEKELNVGDVITVSDSNSGTTYYANSIDEVKPRCVFTDDMSAIKLNKAEYFSIVCEEAGSGASKHITKDSFTISDSSVAEITDVQGPEEILDSESRILGYTYKVGLKGKSMIGTFDIALKANQLVDGFGNGNDEIKEENIMAAEYKAIKKWYVGKNKDTDIIAVLYYNKELPNDIKADDPNDSYTLILYGSGETKYYSDYYSIPWIGEGFQSLITNVIIEDGITTISDGLFQSLTTMNRITLPDTITRIGVGSFRQNPALKRVKIPPLIETIPMNAFEGCKNLEYVELNKGLKTIEETAFLNHGLKELMIPNTVTNIGARAFESSSDNMQLEKLEFETGIQINDILDGTFSNHRLTKIQIPASVQFISTGAFSQYSIDDNTLREVTFEPGSQLTNIFDEAFNFGELSHLELPDTLQSIGNNAFNLGPEISSFTVGPNITSLGNAFIYGDNLREIQVDPANTSFISNNGVLYNKSITTLIKYPDAYYTTHSSYSIPEGVREIQPMAFGGTVRRTSNVTFTLNFPKSLTEINYDTNFIGSFLSEYNVDSENSTYASSDGVLYSKDFKTAFKLPSLYNKTEYTIRDETTTIAMYFGFANLSLKTITIPRSVTGISSLAFYTDPNLAFSKIYLETDDNVGIGESVFDVVKLTDSPSYTRNIYVNTNNLKTRIKSLYPSDDIMIQTRG